MPGKITEEPEGVGTKQQESQRERKEPGRQRSRACLHSLWGPDLLSGSKQLAADSEFGLSRVDQPWLQVSFGLLGGKARLLELVDDRWARGLKKDAKEWRQGLSIKTEAR